VQLGFVIDHSRCIGCHACTVACKSENDVPLGSFRTWVKYTEQGTFPQVKRHFAVLRCNQCTDAPCVTICPVTALDKRADGIVDVNPEVCIGCKGCMQACPYDALYIHPATGTAEKCHFCAHRTESGLAPACAVVCPTEAIIPGDFHDPDSRVSELRREVDLVARKLEASTGPNVYYKEVNASAIDPALTNAAGGFLWANQVPGLQLDAQTYEAFEERATIDSARTVYDIAHPHLWGGRVGAYLFTKSLAAGAFLAGFFVMPPLLPDAGLNSKMVAWVPGLALLWLAVTTILLVADLKRPERFLLILRRPNWNSWIARGAVVLMVYGALLATWLALALLRPGFWGESRSASLALNGVTALFAALSACYTAWLFAQSKGRVLWMKRGLWLHLVAQALVAGAAMLIILTPLVGLGLEGVDRLRRILLVALLLHQGLTLVEGRLAPPGRQEEYERTARLVTRGPFARRHWIVGVGLGMALPIVMLLLFVPPMFWSIASVLALLGLYTEEEILVQAGQALPIS
jgi:Fe-S-cluster-containing dehydrogenase component/formate-dependent nitrite reductase membrane component NrfD